MTMRRFPLSLAISAACIAACVSTFALEPQTFNTDNAQATFRIFDIDNDRTADFLVLQGETLHLLRSRYAFEIVPIAIPDNTRWLDLGKEVEGLKPLGIAVSPTAVYRLNGEEVRPTWQKLFEFPNPLEESGADAAFTQVLATSGEKSIMLIRRSADSLAFDLAGSPVELADSFSQSTPYGLQFEYEEWRIPTSSRNTLAFEIAALRPPALRGDSLSTGPQYDPPRVRQVMESRFENADRWPWMPLSLGENFPERLYFVYDPPEFQRTRTRIRKPGNPNRPLEPAAPTLLPERIYPGRVLVTRNALPDFNSDGYRDMISWTAPDPGRSVARLMRTLNDGAWPVQLSVRLYEPDRESFAVKPDAVLNIRLPIAWFFAGAAGEPFRNLAVCDLNLDGRHDLAMSLTPTLYAVWFWDDGFASQPDFVTETTAPHRLAVPPNAPPFLGEAPIALRSSRALTILPPAANP